MISTKITSVLLKNAKKEVLEDVIKEVINHLSIGYDYSDKKQNHLLEMVAGENIITAADVNLKYIEEHLERICYKAEDYNIRNIKVNNVDNIEGVVVFEYERLEKINEETDMSYASTTTNVSYIDYPEILK